MESRDNDGMLESWLVREYGRVQSIGCREACVRRARALGITGWVRNRIDESVEVMLQGSPEQLAKMCNWLRDGMPAALVDKLEVREVQPPFPRFDRFDRLPTLLVESGDEAVKARRVGDDGDQAPIQHRLQLHQARRASRT